MRAVHLGVMELEGGRFHPQFESDGSIRILGIDLLFHRFIQSQNYVDRNHCRNDRR